MPDGQLVLFNDPIPLAVHAFQLHRQGVGLPVWRSDAWQIRRLHRDTCKAVPA